MPEEKDFIAREYRCPKCSSTERFTQHIVNKVRVKENLPADSFGVLEIKMMPVLNPRPAIPYMPGMIKPVSVAYFDVCWECGTYYCFRAEETEGPLMLQGGQFPKMPRKLT